MSAPRPSEADVNAAESAACPCGHQTLDHAWHGCEQCDCKRSAIHAVLASDWLIDRDDARDAEHEREVADLKAERDWHHARVDVLLAKEAGRVALRGGKPGDYWKGWHVDHCAAAQAAEAAERALADLRGEIKALADVAEPTIYGNLAVPLSAIRALLPRDDAAGGVR